MASLIKHPLLVILLVCQFDEQFLEAKSIDFNLQIKSLLSNRCFACHGPDEENREAQLRLDTFEGATRDLNGYSAVTPGNPGKSEILFRVSLDDDDDELMPPKGKGKRLTKKEVTLLKKWIGQGANYDVHWSYKQPVRVSVPEKVHPVDYFVEKRLHKEGLVYSPLAERRTLARRVSLDLIGLPPTLKELNGFLEDKSSKAYERYLDRLLARKEFGEHWARMWLDLARYADSTGYTDRPRTIWAYRDYVIRAFNRNLPFDQFTIEQLAGDLLPEPTEEQLVATAFHRNTQTNNEGGTSDEEFRNVAVADRVNTTFATWMGTTISCAQCHTHKYDPITHREYFQVFDVFNQSEDSDKPDESPLLVLRDQATERKRLDLKDKISKMRSILAKLRKKNPTILATLPEKTGKLKTRFIRITNLNKDTFLHLAEVEIFKDGKNIALQGTATQSSTDYNGVARLAIDGNTGGDYKEMSVSHTAKEDNPWLEIDLGKEMEIDSIRIFNRTDNRLALRLKSFQVVVFDASKFPLWVSHSKKTPDSLWERYVPSGFDEFSKEEISLLHSFYTKKKFPKIFQMEEKIKALKKQIARIKGPTVPVFRELTPDQRRKTHIHLRGSYLKHGEQVHAGFPRALFSSSRKIEQPNRLDLANWLMHSNNPLTGRVSVNRFWEKIFGVGLVATSEEFGSQGELPTHPQLLDWLASEFVRLDWDMKKFIKLLVTSRTYRQRSLVSDKLIARDPANRLLARGPRIRLSAEMVRDQALAVSGLLSKKMFGPPVRPPQPDFGLKAAFGGGVDWKTSEGEDRYRRGIYVTWRRSNPYPSMETFDAPNREVCTVRRDRTNTPLQALVTLNDPVFVEAAQSLARKMIAGGSSPAAWLRSGFLSCLARPPQKVELDRLVALFKKVRIRYAEDLEMAREMATNPIGPAPKELKLADLAALTVAGNVLLNLDEMLMKR